MQRIIRDFCKAHISMLVRYVIVAAVCIAAFFLTGIFSKDNTRLAGIIVAAFLGAVLVWAFVDVLAAAPARFKKSLSALSDSERRAVLNGYGSAVRLGNRFFYEKDFLLLYSNRRLLLLKYGEITSADAKKSNIFLTLKNGKQALMPVEPTENDTMLLAALKRFNPEIKFLINGEPINLSSEIADGKDNK